MVNISNNALVQFLQENMGFITLRFPIINFAQSKNDASWTLNRTLELQIELRHQLPNLETWFETWQRTSEPRGESPALDYKQHFPVHFSYITLILCLTCEPLVLDQGTFTSDKVPVWSDTNTLWSDKLLTSISLGLDRMSNGFLPTSGNFMNGSDNVRDRYFKAC